MQLWSMETSQAIPTPNYGQTNVAAVTVVLWAPTDQLTVLAYGLEDGSLVVWKAETVRDVYTLTRDVADGLMLGCARSSLPTDVLSSYPPAGGDLLHEVASFVQCSVPPGRCNLLWRCCVP